ncbi:hypothetical protein F4860DRAFT_501776 [Xylaria cubensis]|nr:hypothetical protein F4860DRAFT_501776 [Xylaria cubensis]
MAEIDRSSVNAITRTARKIYHPIGFTKGHNFALWCVFLGTFLGFTISRLQFLDFYGVFCSATAKSATSHAAPGECFYFLQEPYTVGIILHLATILPASLLVCIQFIPVIRRKATLLHRVNGYIIIILSVLSMAGVYIIAPRTFGGGFDAQGLLGALSITFLWALLMSYISIKRRQIDQHRAWMLRAWFWAGSIITGRLIAILVLKLLKSPPYYAMPCDKIDSMLQDRTLDLYPECLSFYSGANPHQNVVVRAEFNHPTSVVEAAAALDAVFGMAYFVAFLLHLFGVEIYLHLTSSETRHSGYVSSKP